MNLLPYLYDFLGLLFSSPAARTYVKAVILFGSAARGEADRQSDIDLFIHTAEQATTRGEALIRDAQNRFVQAVDRKWALMGIDLPIRPVVADLETPRWKELKAEIISSGIVLYGKYQGVKDGLKHCTLFSFSFAHLRQKEKMRLLRKLAGYRQKQGKKLYEHKGLVAELGGTKAGNTILVPAEKAQD